MVSAFKPLVLKTSERYNHNTIEHQKDSQPFYLPKKKQYVTEDFTHNNTTKKIIKQEPDMLDLVNQNLTKSSGRSLNDHIYSIGKETSYFYYTFVVLQEKLRNSFNFSRDKFSDCSKLQKRNYDKGIEELSQTFAQNFLQARKDQTSNISDDLISRTQMVISNSSKERLEKKVKFREPLVVETNNDQKENENQGLEYVQGEFITGSKISSSALTTPNPVVIPKTSIPQLESNSIKIPDSINIELPRTPSGSKRNGAISLKNLKKLKKSPERHKSQPGPAELIKKIEPSNFLPLSTFRVKNSFNIKHFTDDEEYTYESTTDDPNTLTPYETLIKQVPRAVGKNALLKIKESRSLKVTDVLIAIVMWFAESQEKEKAVA
ncbi:hypothetical protein PACTADRAFT_34528 [Pachysolen tannophilus NRRL Y-2460]|uniref:Uncharacterized protein n=1 Tax=Pachysolen tannophilus NRRL Y-2460 TaxID=669874 RepID=A0A1E4TSS1_PACTA|nr:hypothetical protein PACTADRAFT_34528 [Pachysolen tannophilus NRRL Y-2460]